MSFIMFYTDSYIDSKYYSIMGETLWASMMQGHSSD